MIENSFKGHIGIFIFYIIIINYTIFIDQILIFGLSWIQKTIVLIDYYFNIKTVFIFILLLNRINYIIHILLFFNKIT